jgi:hypothetical protein
MAPPNAIDMQIAKCGIERTGFSGYIILPSSSIGKSDTKRSMPEVQWLKP